MATESKTIDPVLLSEAVGNNVWRYFLYNVRIEADSKEDADAMILEAKETLATAEQISADTWKYPELNVRISAATKEDADRRAMDYFLKRKKQGMEKDEGEDETK